MGKLHAHTQYVESFIGEELQVRDYLDDEVARVSRAGAPWAKVEGDKVTICDDVDGDFRDAPGLATDEQRAAIHDAVRTARMRHEAEIRALLEREVALEREARAWVAKGELTTYADHIRHFSEKLHAAVHRPLSPGNVAHALRAEAKNWENRPKEHMAAEFRRLAAVFDSQAGLAPRPDPMGGAR